MSAPIVELDGVSRIHSGRQAPVAALDDVSVTIQCGEFLAVTGPSGSGKSTFLNLAGCLDLPTTGHLRFDGVDVATLDDDERSRLRRDRVGFVFQQFNLLPRMTALDNVTLPLIYAATSRKHRRNRASAMLGRLGLENRADHLPSELSGGEQQRVAIARALVNEPDLILADEPTGSLDSAAAADVLRLLHELNRDGIAIVLVTHDPFVAAGAHRRLAFLDGRVVGNRADVALRTAACGEAS